MMSRTAVVAGATGLIGRHCFQLLTSQSAYSQVIALVRKPSGLVAGREAVERVVDFDALELSDLLPGADIFCALGTTIRIAGSEAAFRKVDYEYVVNLAQQGIRGGARQFAVVSSVSADAQTSNFYLKTKSEMEQALSAMPFHGVHIFRPSFLLGKRQEPRPAERVGVALAKAAAFALQGSWQKYRAIEGKTVAAAMIAAANRAEPGIHIYHYAEMQSLSKVV